MQFTERTKIEAGFTPVFEAEVRPKLLALETDRKARLGRAQRNVAVAGAVTLVVFALLYFVFDAIFFFYFFLGIVGIIGAVIGWTSESTQWNSAVEEAVMPAICGHVGDIEFDSSGGIFPVQELRALGLVPRYDTYDLEDKIWGNHRETPFEMVQANLKRRSRDSDGKTQTSTVFGGLLFHINVPVEAPGRILLLRDRGDWGNKLGEMFSVGSQRSMPKVSFDHDAFEAAFEVYADQPDAARDFMPPAFLDALLAIGVDHGGARGAKAFVAGFQGRSFYMALKRGGAFMKMGSLSTPVTDMENDLHAIFDDIALSHRIIDRLHGG